MEWQVMEWQVMEWQGMVWQGVVVDLHHFGEWQGPC